MEPNTDFCRNVYQKIKVNLRFSFFITFYFDKIIFLGVQLPLDHCIGLCFLQAYNQHELS